MPPSTFSVCQRRRSCMTPTRFRHLVSHRTTCVLTGFPIDLKTKIFFPFGIWFADANTLYVADEGDGDTTFATGSQTYTRLRNITGRVNGDGTVKIWAITSTVSGNGDAGADPNELVMIKDNL